MAQVQYNEGVPDVAPRTSVPDDYQNIRATPEMFGAEIGRGLEEAGKGASTAARFFGDVQVDDAATAAMTRMDKAVNNFRGLRGGDALRAQKDTQDEIEAAYNEGRQGLSTPEQQLKYDQSTRMFRLRYVNGVMQSHADEQAKSYAANTNNDSANLHMSLIAANPYDEQIFHDNTAEVIRARVKQAQIEGRDSEGLQQAANEGRAEAMAARVRAIGVHQPKVALDVLEKNMELASVVDRRSGVSYYDLLAGQLRGRAEQQAGVAAGDRAIAGARGEHPFANPTHPLWVPAAATADGFSPSGLAKTIKIESGGNPNAVNGHAVGLGQFMPQTWDQFGQGDRRNPVESVLATQRYAAANAQTLAPVLGRDPTDAELYLAHQQGGEGAAKLFANPNARAGSLVGDAAIRNNGGDPNAPAFMFTNMWIGRFNGSGGWALPAGLAAPGTIPARPSVRSSAYQAVLADDSLNPSERQHALTYIHQTLAAQDIADNNTDKEQKQMVSAAANEWTQKIHTGHMTTEAVGQLILDPRLNSDWKTRDALINLARTQSGTDVAGASMQYGPGFWALYKRATLPPGDPGRISDVTQVLPRAGEGGDLTLAGVQKLSQIMEQNRKSVSDAAVNTAKVGLINYAKNKLSFEADTGPIKIRDPKGEAIFNGTFLPKFEAAYDAWTKDGKDPWQFLNHENVDKIMAGMRSKSEMAMDKIRATGEASGEAQPNQPAPPAPQGIEQPRWEKLMATRPIAPTGQPIAPRNWADALAMLRADPEKMAPYFKKLWPDFEPAELLKQMEGAEKAAPPTPPEQTFRPAEPKPTFGAHPLSERTGAGPAGYLGDLLRAVVPKRAQEYIAGGEGRGQ
jgi:hypothetical protein